MLRRIEECEVCRSVRGDSLRHLLNTADTRAADDRQLDVSVVTPAGAPGVLYKPVVAGRGVSAPTNREHSVVKVRATGCGVEDTRLVALEDFLVGFNRDGERLRSESSLHLGDVFGRYLGVGGYIHCGGAGLLVLALARNLGRAGRVRVDTLEFGFGCFEVFEGSDLIAAVAAVVRRRAVD